MRKTLIALLLLLMFVPNVYGEEEVESYHCQIHGDIESYILGFDFPDIKGTYCMFCINEWLKDTFGEVEKISDENN